MPVSFKLNEATVNGATRQSQNLVGLPKPHSPLKLINMLSPTTAESALEWRAKCLKNTAMKSRKLLHGDIIEFSKSLSYTDGKT